MENLKEALQDIVHRRENGQPVKESRLAALEVVHKRLEKRENEVLAWLAAAGATISDFEDIASDVVREGARPPQEVIEAIRRQYPEAYDPLSDEDIVSRILSMTEDSRKGLLAGAKGKWFEMETVERLNAGEPVGTITLDPGQTAELISKANHPGSDILIRNADGTIAQELSAKCSEHMSVVHRALEKYPDIPIVGNSELAASHDQVIDSGISEDAFQQVAGKETLDSAANLLDFLEPLGEIAPGLPILFVAAKHTGTAKSVILGRTDAIEALQSALPELTEAAVFTGIALILASFDLGIVSLPIMIGSRRGYKFWKDRSDAKKFIQKSNQQIKDIFENSPRFYPILRTATG